MLAHKVDRVCRRHLRGHHEIALVFAILVVEHDDHLAGPNVGDGIFDRVERTLSAGQLAAEHGKQRGEPLEGAIRRLPPARAEQRNRRLRQPRTLGNLGGREAGIVHGGVEHVGKSVHASRLTDSLDKCQAPKQER